MSSSTDIDALIAELYAVAGDSPDSESTPALFRRAAAALAALKADNHRLRDAILWALGDSDFPERPAGKGQYWWRTELARRAAIDAARAEKP